LEEDGIMFGNVYIEGSTTGISKTCWTKFTSYEEEEKKIVSLKRVTLADM